MANKELIKAKYKDVEIKIDELKSALVDLGEACESANIVFDEFFVSLTISLGDELKYAMVELEGDCGN